jgi:hypothetical protein
VSQKKRIVRAALVMKLVQHVQQLGAIYVGGCSKKDVNRIMMIITRRSEQFLLLLFCFLLLWFWNIIVSFSFTIQVCSCFLLCLNQSLSCMYYMMDYG